MSNGRVKPGPSIKLLSDSPCLVFSSQKADKENQDRRRQEFTEQHVKKFAEKRKRVAAEAATKARQRFPSTEEYVTTQEQKLEPKYSNGDINSNTWTHCNGNTSKSLTSSQTKFSPIQKTSERQVTVI